MIASSIPGNNLRQVVHTHASAGRNGLVAAWPTAVWEVWGLAATPALSLHLSYELGELSQWLSSWWQHHKHWCVYYYYYYNQTHKHTHILASSPQSTDVNWAVNANKDRWLLELFHALLGTTVVQSHTPMSAVLHDSWFTFSFFVHFVTVSTSIILFVSVLCFRTTQSWLWWPQLSVSVQWLPGETSLWNKLLFFNISIKFSTHTRTMHVHGLHSISLFYMLTKLTLSSRVYQW